MPHDLASQDHLYMARALQLARNGLYSTSPNPRVGCVIVRDGIVVGEGWHQRAGEPHAEVLALRMANEFSDLAKGATAYVTLEPCAHFGKTPPCAQALIDAGVSRVVAAMQDPNPQVAGRGLAQLQAAGIATEVGVLEQEARELNIGFVSRMTRQRPWVRVKIASSLDGVSALNNGNSQWITHEAARRDGHHWRARACAILTGMGTVRADNPQLTVREWPADALRAGTPRQPMRVVLDARLEISPQARLFQDIAHGVPLLIATLDSTDEARECALKQAGAEVLRLPPDAQGKPDIAVLLTELAKRGVNELHVEGGAGLNGALLNAGLVDEWLIYLAPTLLGPGRGVLDRSPLTELQQRSDLRIVDLTKVGEDIRIVARPA